jgi:putative ABC transport system permease protein
MLNSTTLNVVERTRELGTLRALGYRRRDLRRQFLRETAILGLLALGVGVLVALGVIALFNSAHLMVEPPGIPGKLWIFLIPTAAVIVGLASVFFTALLAATFVAVRRSSRRGVAELLVNPTT